MKKIIISVFTLISIFILFGGNLNHFNHIKENPLKLISFLFFIVLLSFDFITIYDNISSTLENKIITERTRFCQAVICIISTWFFSLGVFLDWRHTILIEFPYINIIGWLLGYILSSMNYYIYNVYQLDLIYKGK